MAAKLWLAFMFSPEFKCQFLSNENTVYDPKTTHNDSFLHDLSCYSILSLAEDVLNFSKLQGHL